jgi:hypothetical protein
VTLETPLPYALAAIGPYPRLEPFIGYLLEGMHDRHRRRSRNVSSPLYTKPPWILARQHGTSFCYQFPGIGEAYIIKGAERDFLLPPLEGVSEAPCHRFNLDIKIVAGWHPALSGCFRYLDRCLQFQCSDRGFLSGTGHRQKWDLRFP